MFDIRGWSVETAIAPNLKERDLNLLCCFPFRLILYSKQENIVSETTSEWNFCRVRAKRPTEDQQKASRLVALSSSWRWQKWFYQSKHLFHNCLYERLKNLTGKKTKQKREMYQFRRRSVLRQHGFIHLMIDAGCIRSMLGQADI